MQRTRAPPAGSPASGSAAGGSPAAQQAAAHSEVAGVQQAPVAARARPGGGPQAPQAARGGLLGLASQLHAAARSQTAPLSSQRPLSGTAAQAGSQTHQPAAVPRQQKESVLDTMNFQGSACEGWLGNKAVHDSRLVTAAAECANPRVPSGGRAWSLLGLCAGVGAPVLQYWRCWAGCRMQMAVRLTARPARRCCFPSPDAENDCRGQRAGRSSHLGS